MYCFGAIICLMNRRIILSEGEYYHIYNRGVEKRTIFIDNDDRKRFQTLLYLCNGKEQIVYRLIQGETLYYSSSLLSVSHSLTNFLKLCFSEKYSGNVSLDKITASSRTLSQ